MKFRLTVIFLFVTGMIHAQEILSLTDAVRIGLQNNYSIILEKNNAEIARNNNTPGNAGMMPSVGLSATQNNTIYTTHQQAFSGAVKDVKNALNTSINTGLQVNWTLFDGFNMFAAKEMLGKLDEMGEVKSRMVLENTVTDIALLYLAIGQQKKSVEVAANAVALSKERLKIAEAKYKLGSGSQLSMLQATVDMNADSSKLMQQILQLTNLKTDLNFLLARDAETPIETTETTIPEDAVSYQKLLENARSQNPALLSARLDEQITRQELRMAESARYPRFNFQTGYNFIRQKSQTGFAEYNQSYGPYIGVTASISLFNGFNTTRNIKNARLMLNSSETVLQQAGLELQSSMFKLFNNYLSAMEILQLQEQNLDIARQNMEIGLERFRLGTLTDIELREIQNNYTNARFSLLQSQFEMIKARIGMLQLSGDLMVLFR